MAISSPAITKRGNAYNINPKHIVRREGWNPRYDFTRMEEQKATIKLYGVLIPLRVKRIDGDRFELIDGDRRLTNVESLMAEDAAQEARFTTEGVPVIIVDSKQDDVTSLIQMFLSNDGVRFNPLEEADAFRRMKATGMSNEVVAQKTGRSVMTINAGLALLEAPEALQAAVATGTVNTDMARKIAVGARGDKAKQAELTAEAVAAGKDKAKKRAVVAKVEEAKRAKNAAKGKTLMVRPLDAATLSALGAKVAKQLAELLEEQGFKPDGEDFAKLVAKGGTAAAAFSLGALMALKAAAGIKISLTI